MHADRSHRARPRYPIVRIVGILLVASWCLGGRNALADEEVSLNARIDLGSRTIHGSIEIQPEPPAKKLALALFPNRFRDDEGMVNDMTRYYVYPSGTFSPGRITLHSVDGAEGKNGDWRPLATRSLTPPGAPRNSFLEVEMENARRVRITFETLLPERYGEFGVTEHGLSAIGGWYPSLVARDPSGAWRFDEPPPVARVNAQLEIDPGKLVVLGDSVYRSGHPTTITATNTETRSLTLAVLSTGRVIETEASDTTIEVVAPLPRRASRIGFGKDAEELLGDALAVILDSAPSTVPRPDRLTILQLPLRWNLTAPSDGAIVISDRTLHVNSIMRGFHEGQIAQAVYAALLRPRARACEATQDSEWVAQAVAWELSLQFLEKTRPNHQGLDKWIDWLDVFAIVDRFERAPKVPFANAYFENSRSRDELRQSIFTWMMKRAPAPLVLARLDRAVGDAVVQRAASDWVDAMPGECLTFAEALATATGDEPEKAATELATALAPPAPGPPNVRVDLELLPRSPRSKYQFVLDSADVDISSSEFGLSALFVARERGNYRRGLALQPWLTEKSYGIRLGPHFHWGQQNDPNSYRHNLFAFYSIAALQPDFEDDAQPGLRDNGSVGGFGLRYDYSDVWWHDNPTRKRQFRLFLDGYDSALGGHWSFLRWGARARATRTLFSPNTVLAAELLVGFEHAMSDAGVPIQEQFSLGGSKALRGISVNQKLGRNIGLARFEIRQEIFPEFDLNLLDVFTYRRPQLRFFIDTGQVDASAGRALNPAHWAISGGVGIGARYDFLGFFPGVAYIEVATRLDRDQTDFQFLFGSRQAF